MRHFCRTTTLWFVAASISLALVVVTLSPSRGSAGSIADRVASHQNPKTANYYLYSPIPMSDAPALAKYDILVLDPNTQMSSEATLKKIRELNPEIVLLAYVASEEFPLTYYKDWEPSPNQFWHRLYSGITDSMWLYNSSGNHIAFWQQNWMLSPASREWTDYLSTFVTNEFLKEDSVWDGIFYDNVWMDPSWITTDFDLNRDGAPDSRESYLSVWQAGMKRLFSATREKAGRDIIIIGNGPGGYNDCPPVGPGSRSCPNGMYFENFTQNKENDWSWRMNAFRESATKHPEPQTTINGSNTLNTGNFTDYRNVRFGITSALLENSYFGFDYGDQAHNAKQWYDEEDAHLGDPIGVASSQNGFTSYKPDVWRRDFTNGIAVVNATGAAQTVALGGDYEKLHGTQDKATNNGAIVNQVRLDAYDGLVLLKTFQGLQDVVYPNGAFARFLRPEGGRVRNGFFVFDDRYKGGADVASVDLDGNGRRDLIILSQGKLQAWRDDGTEMLKEFPYTAEFTGEMHVALGDLNEDGKSEIYVYAGPGDKKPIKIYDLSGKQIKEDWLPFGAKYGGGYSIAVRRVAGPKNNQLLIGTGKGQKSSVHVYDQSYKIVKEWAPFPKTMTSGISLAAGDVNGDHSDEVIVGAGPGSKPLIRVFDGKWKQVGKEITAYTTFAKPGIIVRSSDVDFDGKDDIIAFSQGF